jgi:hypothetical protein
MTLQEARNLEKEYCRNDIIYFIENYCHIEDKDADELIQPFKLWDMQKQAVHSVMANKLNIILKARQLGFSWLVMSIAAWLLSLNTGRTVIALSRSESEAQELVRRLGVILDNMPEFVMEAKNAPQGYSGATYSKTSMSIKIDYKDAPASVFNAFPSSPNAARSFTADMIIFDEWAFQQFAEEIWKSGFPTINRPFGGKVIGLSSIERGSLFESLFTDPDNNFNKVFIPWYADPRRDSKWYEETKKALGDAITQEYPATIEEALTVPGGSFFPEVSKSTHETNDLLMGNVRRYVALDYGLDMLSVHWIMVDAHKNALVYREYDAPNKTIGEASEIILDLSSDEQIEAFLAPPDLWNRSQESGKSRAILFQEHGLNLIKSSNDFAAGCAGMKEWLKVNADGKPKLQFLENSAPNLIRCLMKIQRDKRRPNVYAKDPHDLTHDPDSLRYFCSWWTLSANPLIQGKKKKWSADMLEDYRNASKTDREYLIKKYGEPY